MIIDIDNSESVISAVKNITKNWIDIDLLYRKIQSDGTVDSNNFWKNTDGLFNTISKKTPFSPEQFKSLFSNRLKEQKFQIMGYHCTRYSHKESFIEKGILPLPQCPIEFPEKQNSEDAEKMLAFRLNESPGPNFCLSYRSAKDPDNHYCNFGAEILLGCNGRQKNNDISQSKPMIIHCAIPFSFLPEPEFYIFCILKAYFNFIDPVDEIENLFFDYKIDLKNKTLLPKYIQKIEEL